LDRIEGNGVRTVIVEDASRFARELVTQELGILALIKRGVRVLTANGDDLTDSSDPSRKMMRQIAGSFAEYEKARLVAKLKAARERKRLTAGKCEGRKSHAESNPEMVQIAKGLRGRKRGNSLRAIAADLAARGYVNANGKEFSAASVASMLGAQGSTAAAECTAAHQGPAHQAVSATDPGSMVDTVRRPSSCAEPSRPWTMPARACCDRP
jgi:DNA invertase Pin-like site-specific DNA recombinase